MAGLSMDELAQKAGGIVTKQAIGKYEKCLMRPSDEVMLRLCLAMGISPDYFSRSARFDLSQLQFRKRSRLPVKKEEALKHRALDFFERYQELEDLLGWNVSFENPLLDPVVRTKTDIEQAALELREKWQLGLAPIVNILELLEEKGIKVFEIGDIEDFDGMSARVGETYVMVIKRESSLDRVRFTAAHELAHILLTFAPDIPGDKELLCHYFAGAFLLPAEVLKRELRGKRRKITFWELKKIKETYGISIQAIMYRAHALGLVSDRQFSNFKNTLNQKGWKKIEPVDYTGKEQAIRFKQLLNYAVAEKILNFGKAAKLADMPESDFQREIEAVL